MKTKTHPKLPFIAHQKGSSRTGPDTWKDYTTDLIVWNIFGDVALTSPTHGGCGSELSVTYCSCIYLKDGSKLGE